MSQLATAPTFKPFNLALIQLGGITSDKNANLKHAREMILKAAGGSEDGKKADLIVLPECFNSPYGVDHFPNYPERIEFKAGHKYDIEKSQSESVKMLSAAAKEVGAWIIGGSIPEQDTDDRLYNTCTVYSPQGDLVAIHRKVHLFDIDIPGKITFKESETLSAGTSTNFFDTDFARIGLGICYDVRFPEMAAIAARKGLNPATLLTQCIGCHALIYPSAFNMTTGPMHWELLQRSRAVDNQIYFSMCSPARDVTSNYIAWGHTMIVDPMQVGFSGAAEDETIIHVHIDPKTFHEARAGIPVTTQRRFDVYVDVAASEPKEK
ncbi:carbon-nitrogen hydrolase [Athelia psychrophila]|uniref:Carbon-nitrogen hydrolase n=1 Tax=Athelia psychrophila TaxID=1759441 RepID=A0A166NCU6_9AGAM|nr:carbon-nitrogen hydrolase [Fibularhizoctonia sp. CBS 109695]